MICLKENCGYLTVLCNFEWGYATPYPLTQLEKVSKMLATRGPKTLVDWAQLLVEEGVLDRVVSEQGSPGLSSPCMTRRTERIRVQFVVTGMEAPSKDCYVVARSPEVLQEPETLILGFVAICSAIQLRYGPFRSLKTT